MRGAALTCIVLMSARAVHADATGDARTHFERGMAHYALGELAQAAEGARAAGEPARAGE